MNRPSRPQVGSVILVIGLVGLARPAAADPRPSLRIALHVDDDDSIPPTVVSRAKDEMSRIYRDAGIDIVWTKEDPQLTLIVLSRELTDGLAVATTALGAAVGTREYRGRTAYVFYNRVERVARTYVNTSHYFRTATRTTASCAPIGTQRTCGSPCMPAEFHKRAGRTDASQAPRVARLRPG
jgi:hypothetical protein